MLDSNNGQLGDGYVLFVVGVLLELVWIREVFDTIEVRR